MGLGSSPKFTHATLQEIQWGVYFRTVTVPSDEALCLSTLLSLKVRPIAEAKTREERMALVWQAISVRYEGLPGRLIFFEDQPLRKPGFKWAPLSLLCPKYRSCFDLSARINRFSVAGYGEPSMGMLTPIGLRVQFPGAKLEPRPLAHGLPLHPWKGIIKPVEDMLFVKHEGTCRWFRIVDWARAKASEVLPLEEMREWDRREDSPLCRAIDKGNCMVIHDLPIAKDRLASAKHRMHPSLLVIPQEPNNYSGNDGLRVQKHRLLIMDSLEGPEATVADGLNSLAMRMAAEDVTKKLLAVSDSEGEEYKAALAEVKKRMGEVALEYWDATPEFARAVHETMGPDMREWIWPAIPKFHSHDIVLVDLPDDQTWVVD